MSKLTPTYLCRTSTTNRILLAKPERNRKHVAFLAISMPGDPAHHDNFLPNRCIALDYVYIFESWHVYALIPPSLRGFRLPYVGNSYDVVCPCDPIIDINTANLLITWSQDVPGTEYAASITLWVLLAVPCTGDNMAFLTSSMRSWQVYVMSPQKRSSNFTALLMSGVLPENKNIFSGRGCQGDGEQNTMKKMMFLVRLIIQSSMYRNFPHFARITT